MTSLHSARIARLLGRLYGQAKKNDDLIQPQLPLEVDVLGGPNGDPKVAALLDETYSPVSPEVGRWLYVLIRAYRPGTVVEVGTSFGISTIHMACALRDNGQGRVITTELNSTKVSRARDNIREAGLSDLVDVRQGDALDTLGEVKGIDFLFLDGWKWLYLPVVKKFESEFSPKCRVVADDTRIFPEALESYLDYVRDPKGRYVSKSVPIGDGIELSVCQSR